MRIFLSLFCCWFFFTAGAQDSLSMEALVPGKAIKVSPLHLFNFYPTIEISYEHRIAKRVTLQLEGGYVLDYGSYDTDFIDKRGVKTKLEARYYFWARDERRKLYYMAAEGYWNAVNFDRKSSRIECFDNDCQSQFVRFYDYKMEYRESGFTLKVGFLKYFGASDVFIDINSGWTIRNVQYREPEELASGGFEDDSVIFFEIPNENDRIAVSPNFGIRFGYRID
jgi:hypothetical protein